MKHIQLQHHDQLFGQPKYLKYLLSVSKDNAADSGNYGFKMSHKILDFMSLCKYNKEVWNCAYAHNAPTPLIFLTQFSTKRERERKLKNTQSLKVIGK